MAVNPRRTRLGEIEQQIAEKDKRVKAIFDAADKEGRSETDDEIKQVKTLNKEMDDLLKKAEDIKALIDAEDGQFKRQVEGQGKSGMVFNNPGSQPGANAPYKNLADIVLDNEHMKAWLEQESHTFKSSSGKAVINSPRVPLGRSIMKRYNPMEEYLKTLITGAGSTTGGPFVFPDFKPIVDQSYQRPLTLRDLITIGETGSDTVEYVRITGVTNNAAETAEATATDDGTGAKPESAMATLRITETVKTVAHWVPVTNRALADAPQLRTYLDSFLRYGIDERLETKMINGNGVGDNFTGILNVSGTTAQAWDTNILTTTRKARTKVRVTGRAVPTAYVMNPLDWETIELTQDNEARFYYQGPAMLAQPKLWGLPVVECEGIAQGQAIVADFKLAILWDRMETMIAMSNQHSDFFVRNLVAILAEMRAAFGVIRPKAFVIADLTA